MRIIAGKYRRREIDFPGHIRPTQDKIRQAVFNCMANAIAGMRVLDLYSGSGAYGLESLSRGASLVYFIDSDRKCSSIIFSNLEKIKLTKDDAAKCFNYTNDAFRALEILKERGIVFDVIFADPPYRVELAKKTLQTLATGGILSHLGFVIIEHSKAEALAEQQGSLILVKELKHSDTVISIYQMQ